MIGELPVVPSEPVETRDASSAARRVLIVS
jgi:hypothetical protein